MKHRKFLHSLFRNRPQHIPTQHTWRQLVRAALTPPQNGHYEGPVNPQVQSKKD